jgi:hypothetical protein
VRLALSGGLAVATFALCGCSSPSIPSWAMATPKSHYLMEKPIAQLSHRRKMQVAPIAEHSHATSNGSYIGGAPGEYEFLEQIEPRRIDSLLAICRGC